MTEEFKTFVKKFESEVIPLHKQAILAYFNATISGKEEDYQSAADLEVQLTKILASKENFRDTQANPRCEYHFRSMLQRQLEVLYLSYLEKQLDEDKLE